MAILTDISGYADQFLRIQHFKDYCPNGLQVEGCVQVKKLASAVSANLHVIERAIDWGAQALVVHHGYFWKNELPQIVGMKKRRLQALMGANMSLLAYHLPLDAHPSVGNNVQLAERLELNQLEPLQRESKGSLGNVGQLSSPITIERFVHRCETLFQRRPLLINGGKDEIQRVALCTGGAQHMIEDAVDCHSDVFLSGEISEQTVHIARECGIHYISAGHHATERYGVQALAEHLASRFELQHRFFDEINPA